MGLPRAHKPGEHWAAWPRMGYLSRSNTWGHQGQAWRSVHTQATGPRSRAVLPRCSMVTDLRQWWRRVKTRNDPEKSEGDRQGLAGFGGELCALLLVFKVSFPTAEASEDHAGLS